MSELKINSKPRCTPPIITNVTQLSNSSVTITWVLNGIDYTSGSILVEVSTNGGASFIGLETVNPINLSVTINSTILSTLSNGQQVIFRLTGNSLNCSNMQSTQYNIVWFKELAETYDVVLKYSCSSNGNGPTNYDVICQGSEYITLMGITGLNAIYRMKISGDNSYIGLTKMNGASISNSQPLSATETLIVQAYLTEPGYPGNYPNGQYIPFPDTLYTFEYSINNGSIWHEFGIIFKD